MDLKHIINIAEKIMLNQEMIKRSTSPNGSTSSSALGGISGLYNKDIAHTFIIEEFKVKNKLHYFPSRYFSVNSSDNAENGKVSYSVGILKEKVREDILALELQMNELKKLLEINEDTEPKIPGKI